MCGRLFRIGSLMLILVALPVAACGSGPRTGSGPVPTAYGPLRAYDPPLRFDTRHPVPVRHIIGAPSGWVLPDVPPVLVGSRLFSYSPDGGLIAADVSTGRDVAAFPPATAATSSGGALIDGTEFDDYYVRPAAVTVGGKTLVVMPFVGILAGTGLNTDRVIARLIAVDPQTLKPQWRMDTDITQYDSQFDAEYPDEGGPYCSGSYYSCVIAGASGNVLVISMQSLTIALDVATRKIVWTSYSVHAMAVAGNQVIGAMAVPGNGATRWNDNGFNLVGLDLRTGRTTWKDQNDTYFTGDPHEPATDPAVFPVGPAQAVIAGSHGVEFINAATGVPARVLDTQIGDPKAVDPASCLYDAVSVLICEGRGQYGDIAYDAVSGKTLWTLPSAGRTNVVVSAAWHGVLYGHAVNSTFGAVVLDARTGQPRELSPGIAPDQVDQFAAISGNFAYRAIG